MSLGKKNAYFCDKCLNYIVTIDIDVGVTPMFLACRATEDCPGTMVSMMYPDEPWPERDPGGREIPTEPNFEWFKPSLKNARRRGPEMYDHVRRGGLDIRPVAARD